MKQKQSFVAVVFLVFAVLVGCKNWGSKTASQTVATTTISVDTSKRFQTPQEYVIESVKTKPIDTLFVDVYANGKIKVGSRNIDIDSLTTNLTDTLKSIKSRTGKFPNVIHARSNGEVLMGIRGATHDAIDEAKKNINFKE